MPVKKELKAELTAVVKAYIESQNWRYEYQADRDIFRFGMNLKNLTNCSVIIKVEDNCIQTFAISPINIPEGMRQAACEFATRANYGLKLGKCEMDIRDGEWRFQTIIVARTCVPHIEEVEYCVDMAYFMLDHYGKGMLAMLYGGATPEKAIEMVEGSHS